LAITLGSLARGDEWQIEMLLKQLWYGSVHLYSERLSENGLHLIGNERLSGPLPESIMMAS
jgi:hypothetical protein